MTHPEIALETTAEERAKLREEIKQAAIWDVNGVNVNRRLLQRSLNDIDTLLARNETLRAELICEKSQYEAAFRKIEELEARVADAERAGRIKGLEEAAELVTAQARKRRGICGDVAVDLYDAAARIRSLIPDPETKEDDNG